MDSSRRHATSILPALRLFLERSYTRRCRSGLACQSAGVVQSLIEAGPGLSRPLRLRSWKDTAREYADAFEGLLDAGINIDLVNRRWQLIRTLDAYHPFA